MKTLKTLFTLLLMTVSMAVSAQTIVAVEKTDGTTDNYNLADVDSVVYEPKAEVKYYYYAGWTCPTNLTELAEYASKSAADGNGTSFKAAEIGTSISGFSYNFATAGNGLTNSSKATFYIVLPNGLAIYDNLGTNVVADQFTTTKLGDDYTIYTSISGTRNLNYLNIK